MYLILSRFEEQIVPDVFDSEDYYRVRGLPHWWKYAFCLQKMSFSGVFRYSRNGYNVPIKKSKGKPMGPIEVRGDYLASLKRWKSLNPIVLNLKYSMLPVGASRDRVVVSDPPYEGSKASYNERGFDYDEYWEYLKKIKDVSRALIVFDRKANLESRGIFPLDSRLMRVAGNHPGDTESVGIYIQGKWQRSWVGVKRALILDPR